MTFEPELVSEFLTIFEESKLLIRAFKGCNHLELLQVTDATNIICTLSFWDSEDSLNNYRQSELFKTTWAKTKALFAEKAEAISFYTIA